MSKSKSNYHIFKFNDNNNKNTHKMHMKNIFSDEYSNNQTIPKKINVLLTSINSDIARFKIRKELTKKLLSTDRESYTYRTNINKDEIIFNKTHKNFNLKFFSKVKKHNYIKSLFKNFLKSLQKHFFHIYTSYSSNSPPQFKSPPSRSYKFVYPISNSVCTACLLRIPDWQ